MKDSAGGGGGELLESAALLVITSLINNIHHVNESFRVVDRCVFNLLMELC